MSQVDQHEGLSEEEFVEHGALKLCPRCGLPGWIYIRNDGNRQYVYMLHKIKQGKRTKTKHCYLGPLGVYKHTYVTNQLQLKGLTDPYRYIKYLRMVLEKISEFASVEDSRTRESIVQQLREAQKMLDNIIKLFESRPSQTE